MPIKKNGLHKLFSHPTKPDFTKAITLPSNDREFLKQARIEVEEAIVDGFKALREHGQWSKQDLPTPKFAMQGSWVYKTMNTPAYPPAQQLDIDVGLYMPFSSLGNGQQPAKATSAYFDVVDDILETFILKSHPEWKLIKKGTCSRIEFPNGYMHLDLPLYAYPDSEEKRIQDTQKQDSAEVTKGLNINRFAADARFLEQVTPTTIHMAHRSEGWKSSDAQIIREWVTTSIREKGLGNSVRQVCRFLKAWRDEQWPSGGGPSSIFLLAFTIREYQQIDSKIDTLLEFVIDKLPMAYATALVIPCPQPDDFRAVEDLRDRVQDPAERERNKQASIRLKTRYAAARQASSQETANTILIELFGTRFPIDPARVIIGESGESIAKVVTASQARPVANRTMSETKAG